MNITDRIEWDGKYYIAEYFDVDTFKNLDQTKCTQSYGVCFYGDKMVIGHNGKKDTWNLIGGTIEEEETPEDALIREIQEESNMKVLSFKPIGYQKVTEEGKEKYGYQLRYLCEVEPFGPFEIDPAGTVDKIKLINPKDYKTYFDWGKKSDAIIKKAIELHTITN